MESVIEVKNLVKQYKKTRAVNGISFEVKKGEVFGLLGQNGAGKTTTLEMIEGLRKPTSGSITVLGHDVIKELTSVKTRIGVQLQSSAYYRSLSLKEILELFASFYGMQINSTSLLDMVDLGFKANEKVENLSGGQQQRFSIIASLVNDPEIVFLDEPTTGLDPIARRNLWFLINNIKQQGKTVVLTTHYMEEAEALCDRVGIMDSGNILAIDETHKLLEKAKYPFMIDFVSKTIDKEHFKKLLELGEETDTTFGRQHLYELKFKSKANLDKAIEIVQSMKPESLTVGRATLEDVFIDLTGRTIVE